MGGVVGVKRTDGGESGEFRLDCCDSGEFRLNCGEFRLNCGEFSEFGSIIGGVVGEFLLDGEVRADVHGERVSSTKSAGGPGCRGASEDTILYLLTKCHPAMTDCCYALFSLLSRDLVLTYDTWIDLRYLA